MDKTYLNLPMDKHDLSIKLERLKQKREELDIIIDKYKFMNCKDFSKSILFYQEIKANNNIEGYNDNIEKVREVIKYKTKDNESRIINLYNGYKYILKNKNINKDNLKKLYNILSNNLLYNKDLMKMGEYYRLDPVYIYYSSNLDIEPDMGLDSSKIDMSMNCLFDFINNFDLGKDTTSEFIKSQILHFYFVYIHPYYDINGRTARTTSMWYLLNKKAYPYIIFNRAIQSHKNEYYKVIRETKTYSNVTFFVKYMMDNVKDELLKEKIINDIKSYEKLNFLEYQTIYYILSMNGIKTVKDFVSFYNKYNDKIKGNEVLEKMIIPLIDKNILVKERDTNTMINSKQKNFVFKINDEFIKK